VDLSHVATAARVSAHAGAAALANALHGADLVVIPAGVPRKPGMTRDDLFNINAGIVRTLLEGVAKYCPDALLNVISNPVNSTVPIAAEVLKAAGAYDPRRLFGVTTLDVMRANAFAAEALGVAPEGVSVPVVGGHAGATILPVLTAATPPVRLPPAAAAALAARIQDAGTEVVKAKAGAGSATLSMAAAAARFADACLRALGGEEGVVECAYVASHLTDLPFLAGPVRLGRGGVAEVLPLPPMSAAERAGFEAMKAELRASIEKGVAFAAHST
jgi:malate dehydrogenase